MQNFTSVLAGSADGSDTFTRWSKPLSDTEEEKANRAARMIRDALKEWPALAGRDIEVYGTGSFRNNTNVRSESDIDVAVVCKDSFFYDAPMGWTPSTLNITTPAPYDFWQFRQDVQNALYAQFGATMQVADKTFNVPENTYRMEADVTPFFQYRRYTGSLTPQMTLAYDEGVKSISRSGTPFINWHHDHYREGVARNQETGGRFKRVTRIVKNVKCEMIEKGDVWAQIAARKIPSFLIECLVFNAPDTCFTTESGYVNDTRNVIANLWGATQPDGSWRDLVEVNRRKSLFLAGQSWQHDAAHEFLQRAWGYLFS